MHAANSPVWEWEGIYLWPLSKIAVLCKIHWSIFSNNNVFLGFRKLPLSKKKNKQKKNRKKLYSVLLFKEKKYFSVLYIHSLWRQKGHWYLFFSDNAPKRGVDFYCIISITTSRKRGVNALFSPVVFLEFTVYYQIPFIPSSLDVRCNHLGRLVCRSRHIRAPESPLSVREVAFFRQSGACLSGQTSLVRRRCHRCWCLCDCDWSGCRWCGKVRAKSQGRPRGKGLQNKSHASASRRLDFPLKGKSEAANLSPVRIHGRDAGRAALPGPFTSVLKKQGGRKKKFCVLGLFSALDHKKNQKCKLHSGYTQEYLLISSSLENNIGGISAQHK